MQPYTGLIQSGDGDYISDIPTCNAPKCFPPIDDQINFANELMAHSKARQLILKKQIAELKTELRAIR